MDEEFRKIFKKFIFTDVSTLEFVIIQLGYEKKDGSEENAATNKKVDSDSKEEENDNEQKEKGKRGIEKSSFQLPDLTVIPGIEKIRPYLDLSKSNESMPPLATATSSCYAVEVALTTSHTPSTSSSLLSLGMT
ncbi:hypothetical protein JHK84_031541 [Glycine max]|nr:hypothetical protein JHK84_031541 [Glycine max]